MNRFFKAGFAGAAFMALAGTAMASSSSPGWVEDPDAGNLPGGAQITIGVGMMGFISGNLGMSMLTGEIDLVDMFLIRIVDPLDFRVTTDPQDDELPKGFAEFDTQLWLFKPVVGGRPEALGLLGNDDHFELGGPFSLLLPDPTDDFGKGLVEPGLYYIAITRSNHDPFSLDDQVPPKQGDIFFQEELTEISGPDGPGGPFKITGWAGDQGGDFAGEYSMALRGVEFAPAPGALSLFIIAAVGARRRRRRSLLR